MNDHDRDFAPPDRNPRSPYSANAERAVLAHCMIDPSIIPDVVGMLNPSDMQHELHRDMLRVLHTLTTDARAPSVQSVLALMGDRHVDAMDLASYIKGLVLDNVVGSPWRDAVETLADGGRRRRLSATGSRLMMGADVVASVAELAVDTIADIDDVLAYYRRSARFAYSGAEAAQYALDMIDSTAPRWPTTGMIDLDGMLGGWPVSELGILAARPGMGKSCCMTSAAIAAARDENPVLIFSLEMTRHQLGARMLTDIAYETGDAIHYEDVMKRRVTAGQIARLNASRDALRDLPIAIEEQPGLTISEIATRARKAAGTLDRQGKRLRVVFVDHIGLVRPSRKHDNRHHELAEITEGLFCIAKELECAVIGLCQLNRGVEGREDKRPGMSDLRDSGSIEENASVIAFPYRPSYYLERKRYDDKAAEDKRRENVEKDKNFLEYIVGKNRNGRVGVVNAFIDLGANAVRNLASAPSHIVPRDRY